MSNNKEKENDQSEENVFEVMRCVDIASAQIMPCWCAEMINEWFARYDDAQYLGYETNKIGDVVVALYHNHTIYLFGDVYRTIMYAPRLMFHFIDSEHIHIDDILMKHNNVGNGSVAMKALLRYAKKSGVRTITGTLSRIDDDHRARLTHYYQKFGFNISDNKIHKNL